MVEVSAAAEVVLAGAIVLEPMVEEKLQFGQIGGAVVGEGVGIRIVSNINAGIIFNYQGNMVTIGDGV